ncbi:hypothetical protein T4E_6745 [Trichinella pseudospiralis]|uniref:Uncharacterized protein n=1 Tax=Trichinella pseudospiralis TaxID=6337 RepID=A0A0V1F331_TRIPS|nr:hypothetical protein T4E_6745 [Trichinella pseudospiralis]KRY80423.1 hypothetical protein T4D_14592 [Trichinella pseudospiralis]
MVFVCAAALVILSSGEGNFQPLHTTNEPTMHQMNVTCNYRWSC